MTFVTPEAQRIAISKACKKAAKEMPGFMDDDGCYQEGMPDYLSDLNAMHEAEKILTDQQQVDYAHALRTIVGWNPMWAATAAQRAEAFLRSLGLWKEDAERAASL